jgi:beta-N-acetylhexosaminidase
MFVAVDAEGGLVNRLQQKYGFLPTLSEQKMGEDNTLKTTDEESQKIAKELHDLGFNMNLAPIVDLNINPKNPIIGALGRSFSNDPQVVVDNSKIFIKNHLENNVIPVEKHFPGQGSAIEDSHLGTTDVTNEYSQKELVPYQELNNANLLDAVMVGHIINKNIDKNYPATLSPVFLQNILRNQIGFKGVIISDDMEMAAISQNYKFADAIIRSVNAGCDIISVLNNNNPQGYDKDIAYKVRDIIFNAVKNGEIKEKTITDSYNRIIDLKKKYKIVVSKEEQDQEISEIKNQKFELLGVQESITFQQALDNANYVAQKTEIRPAFLMAIFQEELTLEKTDLCYLKDFKTGEGIRFDNGKKLLRVMNSRDIPDFLKITKDLKKDPLKTLVTCPMSFGWGGAMGPADFIPSTWLKYKDKIEKITGKSADPWNIQDAFLASGLYLSESGVKSKDHNGEWNAAMIYFSGSIKSPYTFYADGALKIADEIQENIDKIEKNN